MEEPFFSIVMPIYNARRFMPRAVESVLAQCFGDFELILVEDASSDESLAQCRAYCARDKRVRLIALNENVGAGPARNIGLDAARGRYVQFMDADDALDADALKTVAAALRAHPAQVTVFGAVEEYFQDERRVYENPIVPEGAMSLRGEALRRAVMPLEMATLYGYVWNKFYERAALRARGVRFESALLNEDMVFNAAFFDSAETMNVLPFAPYHYRIRAAENLTGQYVPEYYALHRRRVALLLRQHRAWGLLDDSVKNALAILYARYTVSALQRNCDPRAGMSGRDRRAWLELVYEDELYRELSPHMHSQSLASQALCRLLARRRTTALLGAARFVYFVKKRCPAMFVRLKQGK